MLSAIGQRLLCLLLVLLLLAGSASPAFAIQFNALWRYRQSGGEGLETLDNFSQRYSLGIGEAITYQPTHAIRASAAVGYTHSQGNSGKGFSNSNDLTPTAQLSLLNDIFLAQVSGTSAYSKSGSGDTQKRNFWDTALASSWDIPLFPTLGFTYGETNESETEKEKNSNFTINWDLVLAQLSYRYGTNQSENENILVDSTYQSARFATGGSFWQNRAGFNFTQQFGKTTNDTAIKALEGGFVDFALEVQATSAVDDPVTGPDPEDIVLGSIPQLTDEDFETVALVVEPNQRISLGISLGFTEDIGLMRLSLDPLTTLTEDQALALQWNLYVRDAFNTAWELQTLEIPFTYDPVEKHFELVIDLNESEIMVLAVNEANIPLDFTELEAFSLLSEDNSSTNTTSLTNAGMRIRLTRTLSASSSLNLDHTETDFTDSEETDTLETDRWTASGSLRWAPTQSVGSSLGFSENRYEQTGEPEEISRVYSLNVNVSPLPSLDVSLGTNLNERYSDELKTETGTRYYLSTRAVLYPDLKASWSLSYSQNKTLDIDKGFFVSDDAISSRLALNAELQRNLLADIVTNYTHRDREDTGITQSGNATLGLRYRPSDLLALRGSYTTSFGDFKSTDRFNLGLNLTLINTPKARLIFAATHSRADAATSNLGLNWTWDISRYFTLVSNANYRLGDINTYNFQVTLAMRL